MLSCVIAEKLVGSPSSLLACGNVRGASGGGRGYGGGGGGGQRRFVANLIRLHKGSRLQASHVLDEAAHGGHAGAAPHQQHLADRGSPLRPQLRQGGCLLLALTPPLLLHLLIRPDRPQIHTCLQAPAPPH